MAAGDDFLATGQALGPGQFLRSANGLYRMILQTDGNLVLTALAADGHRHPIWSSNTAGRASQKCIMQGDGNLVLYTAQNQPLWASDTAGNAGSRLAMQNDGNLVLYRVDGRAIWATDTARAASTGPSAAGHKANPGETLGVDEPLRSPNGRYELIFQSDGNLVLYKTYSGYPRRALWASGTAGRTAAVCILQGDGNLVLYAPSGGVLWSSETPGNPGSTLFVQDDGNVVIRRGDSSSAWATGTVQPTIPSGPPAAGDRMKPGQTLARDKPIFSANGRYSLVFQSNGNLVLYKHLAPRRRAVRGGSISIPGRRLPLWDAGTYDRRAEVCIMQRDGNLVIYDADAMPVWSSGSEGRAGSFLIVQDDGNAVVYEGRAARWATRTAALKVHFKSVVPLALASPTFTNEFNQMDDLFAAGRINVELASVEDLSPLPGIAAFETLEVGIFRGEPSAEQEALFAHRNHAGPKDIVAYWCRVLVSETGMPAGTGVHPDERPGCVVALTLGQWILAHEVAHVLGLNHVEENNAANRRYLMWPYADEWIDWPPNLSGREYEWMRASDLIPK